MRKFIHQDKAKQIRVERWWAVVLNKGDVLYVLAKDERDAIERIFGTTSSWAVRHSIHGVFPCKLAVAADLTFS